MLIAVLSDEVQADYDPDESFTGFGSFLRQHSNYYHVNELLEMDTSLNLTDEEFAKKFLRKWKAISSKNRWIGRRQELVHPMYVIL